MTAGASARRAEWKLSHPSYLTPCPQPPRCARGDFVTYWEGGTRLLSLWGPEQRGGRSNLDADHPDTTPQCGYRESKRFTLQPSLKQGRGF